MLNKFFLALILLSVAYKATAENLECKYERRFKGFGSKQADLKIRSDDAKITQLVTSSTFASGKEGGVYGCYINTAQRDQTVKWSTNGKKTLLQITSDYARPSNIEIESTTKGYRVSLKGVSLDVCGFGAEWPKSIEVMRGSKNCKVIYDQHE